MEVPDNIYVTPAFISNHQLDKHDYEQDVVYIRKDYLLEWANEQIKVAKVNNLAYSPFEKLINKLESK